ncbi:GntR family transcriptional regulator [Nonomuraea sp. NPDC003707]
MEKRSGEEGQKIHASHKLAAIIRADIEAGQWPAGARLPSYRQLAEKYEVAQNTAQAAVRILQAEGMVTIRAASGAYVLDPAEAPLTSTSDQLRAELAEVKQQIKDARKMLVSAEDALAGLVDRLHAK